MQDFSQRNRIEFLRKATSQQYDLCVVGGGITGAGIALDAVSRGLTVLLVEKNDFASGTSGKSTKLIHGGLRYLKNLEFGLVREVGRERRIVYENAPHVTRPEPLLLPLIRGGSLGEWGATIGLWLYDYLAGVKKAEQRRMVRKASVMAMEPGLDEKKVLSGAWYYEYRTDDARLCLEVLKKAHEMGAHLINYAEAYAFHFSTDVSTISVKDNFSDTTFSINASVVVNASGPWLDSVVKLQNNVEKPKLLLSQGIHVVVDAARMPIGQALYFDTPDKRMIFAIPREGKVYIGTTEHLCSLEDAEVIKKEHALYLLNCVNHLFPDAALELRDVESAWAGVRPLILQEGKKPGEVSRKDELFEHASGMISIAGGKLTGYRKMAERTVNLVMKRLKKNAPCISDQIKLCGTNQAWNAETIVSKAAQFVAEAQRNGLPERVAYAWAWRYGSTSETLFKHWKNENSGDSVHGWLKSELEYSISHEMLCTTMDFLIRRTSMFYFDFAKAKDLSTFVHQYLAAKLNWNEAQKKHDLQNISINFLRIKQLTEI